MWVRVRGWRVVSAGTDAAARLTLRHTESGVPYVRPSLGVPDPATGRPMRVYRSFPGMTDEQAADAAIAAVRKLGEDVGIPKTCKGLVEEDLDQLAKDALADACYPGNPREATPEQVKDMFRKIMA